IRLTAFPPPPPTPTTIISAFCPPSSNSKGIAPVSPDFIISSVRLLVCPRVFSPSFFGAKLLECLEVLLPQTLEDLVPPAVLVEALDERRQLDPREVLGELLGPAPLEPADVAALHENAVTDAVGDVVSG